MNKKIKIPSLKAQKVIKRALFFSFGKSKGSMAFEGSLVLPVFLFFMMTVLLSLEAVRFQSDVLEALHQAGNRAAFEGYREKYDGGEKTGVEGQIKEYLSSQLYPYLCVSGEENGIQVSDLSAVEEDGQIEILAEYGLKPFIEWLPIGEIKVRDRFLGHAWVGYCRREGQGSKVFEKYVYVTKTGSRYHLSYNCTYLGSQLQAVNFEDILFMRNTSGGKYYACQRCRPAKGGIVYITESGQAYHGLSDCPGLKRTIYMIPLSEAKGYNACSKCAG